MDTTSIWPDQLDSPATLPPRVDNRDYNLAVDINESREFMQKAERIIGEMAHGGGVTNFYCTTPDVPGLRIKIAGGVAWFSDTTLVRKQAGPYVSPDVTPPVTDPRIDLLTLDNAGVFAWTQGVENAVPVVPAYPTGKYPICEIYTRPTMTTVLARPEDDDLVNGYIRYPIAPFASVPTLIPPTGGHDIYDEVTLLPTRAKLRFKGTAITAVDNSGANATDVTVAVTTSDITGQLADTRIDSGIVNDGITQPSSDAAVTLDERINDLAKMLRVTTGTSNWYDSPDATNNGLWAKFHDTTGHTHSGAGNNGPQLTNAGIAVGAGIVYAKLALAGGIVNADINAGAAIAASKIAAGTFTGTFVGNSDTATLLQTARTINGVGFDGGSNIVVAAAAGTLTGATLAATVLASSLTSVGTLSALTVTGLVTANGGLTVVGALTLPTGSITSAMILNDTILNADINSAAAIDYTKLALTNSIVSGDIVSLVASKVTAGTFGAGNYTFPGNLIFSAASAKIIPGATSLLLRDTADANTNMSITDAGVVTFRAAVGGITTLNATSLVGALTGNASTATVLQTARLINGVSFDGSADISITTGAAAAGTLTGTTLAANVVNSSLTSVGTLTGLTIGTLTGVVKAASGVISASTLVNADVSASAAIAYSKLTLTNSIVNADVSASAAIVASKIAAGTFGTGDYTINGSSIPLTLNMASGDNYLRWRANGVDFGYVGRTDAVPSFDMGSYSNSVPVTFWVGNHSIVSLTNTTATISYATTLSSTLRVNSVISVGAAPFTAVGIYSALSVNADASLHYAASLGLFGSQIATTNSDTLYGQIITVGHSANSKTGLTAIGLYVEGNGALTSAFSTSYGLKVNAYSGATVNYGIGLTGSFKFLDASASIIPGATSLLIRNNADNATNLSITDAGAATIGRGALTTTIGLNVGTATGAGSGEIRVYNSGSAYGLVQAYDGSSYRQLFIDGSAIGGLISGTQKLWLNSTGLGIGVSPSFPLHVAANNASSAAVISQASASGYGLALIPGSDTLATLTMNNAANSVNRHLFYGNGNADIAQGAGGLQVGAATGGNLGSGKINSAGDIYRNNAAYTNPDYALEHYYTGRIEKYKDNPGAGLYAGLMPLSELDNYMRKNYRLPGISDDPMGLFDRGDILLEKIEELSIYIIQINKRIEVLESK